MTDFKTFKAEALSVTPHKLKWREKGNDLTSWRICRSDINHNLAVISPYIHLDEKGIPIKYKKYSYALLVDNNGYIVGLPYKKGTDPKNATDDFLRVQRNIDFGIKEFNRKYPDRQVQTVRWDQINRGKLQYFDC